jgi:hypothetical protein
MKRPPFPAALSLPSKRDYYRPAFPQERCGLGRRPVSPRYTPTAIGAARIPPIKSTQKFRKPEGFFEAITRKLPGVAIWPLETYATDPEGTPVAAQRHCTPVRLSRSDRSFQFGRASARPPSLGQIYQIRHDRAACSCGPGGVLLWTIGGALIQPVCQTGGWPELLEEACDVVATLPPACRTFEAQHVELAD